MAVGKVAVAVAVAVAGMMAGMAAAMVAAVVWPKGTNNRARRPCQSG